MKTFQHKIVQPDYLGQDETIETISTFLFFFSIFRKYSLFINRLRITHKALNTKIERGHVSYSPITGTEQLFVLGLVVARLVFKVRTLS